MKLWVDEDLSPSLVQIAQRRGYDAAPNRDRGLLGGTDAEVLQRCIDEDRALVTNNYGDFRRLCERQCAHPGLMVLPTPSRRAQQELFSRALAYVERQAQASRAADPGEFMINRVVEISEDGECADFPLPASH
jgi:predicted nuclease of predicted toxin-antitoxin system